MFDSCPPTTIACVLQQSRIKLKGLSGDVVIDFPYRVRRSLMHINFAPLVRGHNQYPRDGVSFRLVVVP